MIGNDGIRSAQPRWPHVVANAVADHGVLPVPDASAFEPDTFASEDITAVHRTPQAEAAKRRNAANDTNLDDLAMPE